MKVLIIRFSSIGDIVLTTPVIRSVKVQFEDGEVHFCTKKNYADLVENNPYVDKVLTLDGSLSELIKRIQKEKYDGIIDLHNNLRTRIIKWRTGVKTWSFNKLNLEKWMMVALKIDQLPNLHIVERYAQAAAKFGVKLDKLGLDYFIPEKDEVPRDWLPVTHQREYAVVAIGGQHATKRLPFQKLVQLCDKINKPVILLGGVEDAAVGERLELFFGRDNGNGHLEAGLERLNKRAIIFNGCGKFNLNQAASVIKGARWVFSHDTGLMHIAAAFKKDIFSIWGNTIPQFGMYPYHTHFTVIEKTGLPCRPCSKIGYDKCPKGHFRCMNDLEFDFYLE